MLPSDSPDPPDRAVAPGPLPRTGGESPGPRSPSPPDARLFLADPPLERADGSHRGTRLVLGGEELEHARSLRLRVGAPCEGLDGFGARWPLLVHELGRRGLVVEVAGDPRREPGPGEPGARLPWIEVAVAWPRKSRAEPMVGALTQLGVAALTALDARFRGPEPVPAEPPARWARLAREAAKQSGRAWLPRLAGATPLERLLEARPAAAVAALDPEATLPFDSWLRSLVPGSGGAPGSPTRPVLLCIGPEGGFAEGEREALRRAGGTAVWLGPHVLRVETAALAAAAVAVTVLGSPLR